MKPKNAVRLDRTIGPLVYRIHRALYRLSGGRIGRNTAQGPILLLTTIGRKSGEPRTTALLYVPDGDDCVVVASNGGRPEMPAWLLNLRASPDCQVQIGRTRRPARAEILTGDAKTEMWERVTTVYAGWAHYQTLTDRELPVVVLHTA